MLAVGTDSMAEPTYEELKVRIAQLEAELAAPALPRRKAEGQSIACRPKPYPAARSSQTNSRSASTPAQRRARKVMFWWYVTLAFCLYVIIQLTMEWGVKGFFAGIALSVVWNLVFWSKGVSFIPLKPTSERNQCIWRWSRRGRNSPGGLNPTFFPLGAK
jgi:hypothetical protein